MLKISNLNKSYKNKTVVNNISFEVNKGEVFALIGSNGAGKTTTIKMILGLTKKDSGEINLSDKVIGYSPETPYFPPFLTGREVLEYYGKLMKIENKELENEVCDLLQNVGLEDDKVKVKNYSKGMLQRLALAQALLGDPELLILDEPCAGLDAMGRVEMIEIIKRLKARGKTIIINSHILSDIEKVCDKGIIMKKGNLLKKWSKEDIKEKTLEEIFVEIVGGVA